MSSDRRSRASGRPRQRPADRERATPSQERRDPRRRTAYVPRRKSSRAATSEQPDAGPPQRRRPDPPRYRTQQPPYRAPREEPVDDYDFIDVDEADDRVIENDRDYAPPRSRSNRRPQAAPRSRQPEPVYEDDYYDDTPYGADPYADDEFDDYSDGYDDSFIDEDDWYEEEAAAGGYRPRGRTTRRRSAPSLPRPSISISRPNVPRPVVPVRIKEAALVNDRSALILLGALLLSTLAMALLTMNRVDSLAPGFATHVTASGIQEEFRSEEALWRLPLMAGALLLMNAVAAWVLANYSTFSSRFLLATSLLVQLVIWVALIRIAF